MKTGTAAPPQRKNAEIFELMARRQASAANAAATSARGESTAHASKMLPVSAARPALHVWAGADVAQIRKATALNASATISALAARLSPNGVGTSARSALLGGRVSIPRVSAVRAAPAIPPGSRAGPSEPRNRRRTPGRL